MGIEVCTDKFTFANLHLHFEYPENRYINVTNYYTLKKIIIVTINTNK